ncbi:putative cytochrome P450 [Helianthus annuus]|nr:putative cytochrome P450 [Helianthus annuus]KAJ0472576.1 putative cytochrome P450 [Helianthus annuus]KAJ0648180.1 putative cytochrome P450 [Helianthus annuus]KAJ0652024.1 putative cytochrome P450 [Helianthus annuus]
MDTNLLIFVLLPILTLVLIIFKTKTKPNLPPGPLSLPVLGHLHLLKQQPFHETLLNLSHKYGPIMLLRFGVRTAVIITSPSLVEECFTKTNDIVLANRPLTPSLKHFSYNYTTMGAAPYGDLWRTLRRVAASELLSTARLDATTHLREHEVKLMCRQIINQSSRQVNLKSWFKELLFNITTMAIMGKRYYGDYTNVGDLKQVLAFKDMIEDMFKLIHTPNVVDLLPVLGWFGFGGVEKKILCMMDRVDKFLQEVIEERRRIGSCESGIMVDKLLALQQQEPEFYTDEIIKGFILVKLYFFSSKFQVRFFHGHKRYEL